MSERSRLVQSIVAGVGVFGVCVWPIVLIWRAGTSGSVGDLSELRFAGFGLAYSIALAVVAGRLMQHALERSSASGPNGRLDPWGAYALGVGVFTVTITAIPGIMFLLLVTDEDMSLRSREWLITLLWVCLLYTSDAADDSVYV